MSLETPTQGAFPPQRSVRWVKGSIGMSTAEIGFPGKLSLEESF